MLNVKYPNETNFLPDNYHQDVTHNISRSVYWDEPGLKIIRFRLLTDPGYPAWDVSYCHGRLPSGEYVDVQLPFGDLPKRGLKRAIVNYAKKDKVYAKGIGIFDAMSNLW